MVFVIFHGSAKRPAIMETADCIMLGKSVGVFWRLATCQIFHFWAYTVAGSWSTPLLENEAYFVQSPHMTGFRSTFSNASSQKQMLNYFFKFNPIHRNLNYKSELLIPQNTKKLPSFWKSPDWLQNAYLPFNEI